MKKVFELIATILILTPLACLADNYVTAGDGQTYSFAKLATIAGSGVTQDGSGFVVIGTVEISESDHFIMDSGATVYFADESELIIKGIPTLTPEEPTTLTIKTGATHPYNIEVEGGESQVKVSNLHFEYVGLRCSNRYGMEVTDCIFTNHTGTQSAALMMGPDEAPFVVRNCHFANNAKAAIGSAANFFCPVKIEDCTFFHNSTANGNIPQLNLTASSLVKVIGCTIEGDPDLNMVGGIGVSNFYGTEGFNIIISDNTITDNRYGITTMGIMDVVISNNILTDNCHENNPNNGGSGISLYDPYRKQNATLRGNYIENSLWGVTIIACGNVNLGRVDVDANESTYNPGGNVFRNNGNSGALYDLYNNSSNTVYAQGNKWNVAEQTEEQIESVIYHKNDDASLGEVIYMPTMEETTIHDVLNPTSTVDIYKMDGTKVNQNGKDKLPKGIYITNGKKYIVK
ncbi:MAG: hypothetical protein IKT00_07640 [Prevotella sp.]|nr:hypothetical protein [Prevotella sp.]